MKRDDLIFELIEKEHQRQLKGIELIASENFVSDQVMQAMGSCLTNKYAEGYPGKRYYGGCEDVDILENLAIERAKKLFGLRRITAGQFGIMVQINMPVCLLRNLVNWQKILTNFLMK